MQGQLADWLSAVEDLDGDVAMIQGANADAQPGKSN